MTRKSREAIAEAGRRLRDMREEAGMSTIDMAYHLEVTDRTITNWESGRTDAGKVGLIAYQTMTRKRVRELARRTSACDEVCGSDALRLFDPDALPAVIDLRDRTVTQIAPVEPMRLYATAS